MAQDQDPFEAGFKACLGVLWALVVVVGVAVQIAFLTVAIGLAIFAGSTVLAFLGSIIDPRFKGVAVITGWLIVGYLVWRLAKRKDKERRKS